MKNTIQLLPVNSSYRREIWTTGTKKNGKKCHLSFLREDDF